MSCINYNGKAGTVLFTYLNVFYVIGHNRTVFSIDFSYTQLSQDTEFENQYHFFEENPTVFDSD